MELLSLTTCTPFCLQKRRKLKESEEEEIKGAQEQVSVFCLFC